ncbi:MAG: dihydroneopterin aldolase [Chitinophagaceae bacterium]|nr:dihydroneopterin aldolase [Chitinophagaceae bacterium]MCW5929101.1 dihydroneopterin aldolase [Chitinophagaceae bacterium]
MIHISLHHLTFRAFHGVHEEEKILGNDFAVDLDIYFEEPVELINRLEQTIDYSVLYDLVKTHMQLPEPLLETLAMDMAADIKRKYDQVVEINVSISKLNMPLVNFRGNISVAYHKKYDRHKRT